MRCISRSQTVRNTPTGATSWLAMATVVHSPAAAVGVMMVGSLGTACSDVVVDSIVVERSRGEPQVGDCHSALTIREPTVVAASVLLHQSLSS